MAQALGKRSFDVLVSGLALAITSPLFLCIGLAIRLDSPGPVFFRQSRMGRGKKLFELYKFRTMVEGAERKGPAITVSRDERITRIGRVLRTLELDELPNLLNVLRGEMSFVGPRPEIPKFLPYYRGEHERVFSVRPGLTDLGTLHFRDEAKLLRDAEDPEAVYVERILPEKLRLNVEYIERQSVLSDFAILFRTVVLILSKRRP